MTILMILASAAPIEPKVTSDSNVTAKPTNFTWIAEYAVPMLSSPVTPTLTLVLSTTIRLMRNLPLKVGASS
jgi:hypothetical protein